MILPPNTKELKQIWKKLTGGNVLQLVMQREKSPVQRSRVLVSAMCFATLLPISMLTIKAEAADRNINKNWRSIAIKGYDPVAYFTMDEAVKGNAKFEYQWQDARWRFASKKHLRMFADNPERYAPRFGGYCAEGMALGRSASIDPKAWLIVNNELYLNYSIEARDEMALDPQKTILQAEHYWRKLKKLFQQP